MQSASKFGVGQGWFRQEGTDQQGLPEARPDGGKTHSPLCPGRQWPVVTGDLGLRRALAWTYPCLGVRHGQHPGGPRGLRPAECQIQTERRRRCKPLGVVRCWYAESCDLRYARHTSAAASLDAGRSKNLPLLARHVLARLILDPGKETHEDFGGNSSL